MSPADLDNALAGARSILDDDDEPDPDPDLKEILTLDDIRADHELVIEDIDYSEPFRAHMNYQEAIQAVYERYEARVQPYRATQERNRGVKLKEIVALERARDQELDRLHRAHERASQYGRAHRNQPMQYATAKERQAEVAGLSALGSQIPGSRRPPVQNAGRSTRDIFAWYSELNSSFAN